MLHQSKKIKQEEEDKDMRPNACAFGRDGKETPQRRMKGR